MQDFVNPRKLEHTKINESIVFNLSKPNFSDDLAKNVLPTSAYVISCFIISKPYNGIL